MKEAPRTISRRKFLQRSSALLGASVINAACGGGSESTTPTATTVKPAETALSPTFPIATATPTEVLATSTPEAPSFKPGERGLHDSIDQMKGTPAQKERVKKIFEGNQVEFINDTSAGGLMPDILDRLDCPELGVVGGKVTPCTSVNGLRVNVEDLGVNAGQLIDKVGQEGITRMEQRDGEARYVAYDANTDTIQRFSLKPGTFFVYLYIGQPPTVDDPRQIIFSETTGIGNISTYYPEDNVMKVELFNKDPLGSTARGSEKIAAAASIAGYHAIQSLPQVADYNFDGRASFNITSQNEDEFVGAAQQFLQILAPEFDKGNKTSAILANGAYNFTDANGNPITRTTNWK